MKYIETKELDKPMDGLLLKERTTLPLTSEQARRDAKAFLVPNQA